MSPLLFVLATDMLLHRIQQESPDSTARAHADDDAVVLRKFLREAPVVLKVHSDFAIFSGLRLNNAQTVVIPLWETTVH